MPMVAIKKPYTLFIKDDTIIDSPRETDDCFGKMVCFHRRYNLGDEHNFSDKDDFLYSLFVDTIGDDEKAEREYERLQAKFDPRDYHGRGGYYEAVDNAILEVIERKHVILPLYLYDHSGITMNTTGFSCPWDSGQVGWIYASKDDILKEYGGKNLTQEKREKAETLLRGEVEYYDHYIRGDCYGFQLYKDDEELDSCWGFIGDPTDLQDAIESYLPEDCKGIMNNLVFRYDDPDIDDILQEQEDELEVG